MQPTATMRSKATSRTRSLSNSDSSQSQREGHTARCVPPLVNPSFLRPWAHLCVSQSLRYGVGIDPRIYQALRTASGAVPVRDACVCMGLLPRHLRQRRWLPGAEKNLRPRTPFLVTYEGSGMPSAIESGRDPAQPPFRSAAVGWLHRSPGTLSGNPRRHRRWSRYRAP